MRLKKLFKNPDFLGLSVVIVFAILAARFLFTPGYFNMHDDLQMMRQFEMEKCFLDLQIPCRWIPDMGYGFGFPLFNFYPPLPYLIGEVFRVLSFSFVDTIKIISALSFIFSGITMYLLAKEFFGRIGGVLSSIFYVWAPYHAIDVYVRGAMNEAWALVWFPLILWSSYRLIKKDGSLKKWSLLLALSWTGLFLSHNLMVLIFTPIFGFWCLLFLWREKTWKTLPVLVLSGILALGLAAFFTLPAILEQKYVQVNTLVTGYYEYIAHFVSLNQLFISRFWGYGPSIWGDNDGMPFQIGHIHWVVSLVILALLIWKYTKTRKLESLSMVVGLMLFIGWFAAFMAHSRSTFFWQAIPPLKFVQFPWRFLTIVILTFSFAAGSIILFLKKKLYKLLVIGLLISGLMILNWNYFRPEHMGPLTDKEKFSGAAWELQQTAGIYDYLPKDAYTAPKEPQRNLAEIIDGEAKIIDPSQGTKWAKFKVNVESDKAIIRLGIFKFPGWNVYVDGKIIGTKVPTEEKWGRMWIEVSKGEHSISAKFLNTPIRSFANATSIVFWALFLCLLFNKRKDLSNFA